MKAIRWLGAFRKSSKSLNESLVYELSRPATDEVAAEPLDDEPSVVAAKVGLLIEKGAIKKVFNGDCWSEYGDDGRLYKTRNPRRAWSNHREVWASPQYTGIVLKGKDLPKRTTKTIIWVSEQYGLPIYKLDKKGEMKQIVL